MEAQTDYLTVDTCFRNDIIKDALRSKFTNNKNKITDEAVDLVSELAKILTIEAAVRAAKQTTSENKRTVCLEHVETILPQMMMDMP